MKGGLGKGGEEGSEKEGRKGGRIGGEKRVIREGGVMEWKIRE